MTTIPYWNFPQEYWLRELDLAGSRIEKCGIPMYNTDRASVCISQLERSTKFDPALATQGVDTL